MLVIGGRLIIPAALLALAILGYVSVGAGDGGGGGVAILVSIALMLVALRRARKDPAQAAVVDRIGSRALMLLPGAVVVYLSYSSGGFFPGPPSLVAIVLALMLAGRLLLGAREEPTSRWTAAMAVAFAAYTAWVALSAVWSHAPERAMIEADLPLVYGLAFVLFATSVRGTRDMRWVVRGLALGSFVVCLGAFLARARPDLWPIAAHLDSARLGYPLTYWNALGLLATTGLVLCVGLTSDDRESRRVKTISALPVPLFAVTLLLTFSRGAIAAALVALLVYALAARPRSLLSATIAIVPTTAFAVVVAYRATSLATVFDGSVLQASQGRHVALVLVVCSLAAAVARGILAGLDVRPRRLTERHPLSPRVARTGWALALVLVVVGSLAAGLPRGIARQYDRFVQGDRGVRHAVLRDRLTDPGANGRITVWRVALDEFDGAPLKGTGAGTYEVVWTVRRPSLQFHVLDAHSVYLENLGELGVVGFVGFLLLLLGSLWAIARRVRGPDRALYAAGLAVALAWALHAGIDWDWEMPAVTLPIFVLAGAALGRPASTGALRSRWRPLVGFVVLLVAIVPALLSVSQRRLDVSLAAFDHADCVTATTEAQSSLEPLSFRHAAHEILGYCHAAHGEIDQAVAEMTMAIRADPKNWEASYGLAVVLAAGGRDPRPAAETALALNPLKDVVVRAVKTFRTTPRARWVQYAATAELPIYGQYGPVLAELSASPQG